MSHVDFLYKNPVRDIGEIKLGSHEEANLKTCFTNFGSYSPRTEGVVLVGLLRSYEL